MYFGNNTITRPAGTSLLRFEHLKNMRQPINGKILIIDDNDDLLKAAKIFLRRHFIKVDTETNPDLLPILLHNESYDVIMLDMNFTKEVSSGQEGFY